MTTDGGSAIPKAVPAPVWLRRQLSGPRGVLSEPMAWLLNRVNRREYHHALRALAPERDETVLELGFGGGLGISLLLSAGVRVKAAEPSEAMRARAYRRFATALARGELEICDHGAEDLPEGMAVDRALSMNTVYFWSDVDAGFERLAKVVRGRVVLGIASPQHLRQAGFHLSGFRIQPMSFYVEQLRAAGFSARVQDVDDAAANLLIGERSAGP